MKISIYVMEMELTAAFQEGSVRRAAEAD